MRRVRNRRLLLLLLAGVFLLAPARAEAYVGPGAGFAIATTFYLLVYTFFAGLIAFCTYPFRLALNFWRGRRARKLSRVKRLVIVGFDGMDPELTERYMEEGLLPNFARLREEGGFHRLATSLPAESPVAWSSFQTGGNPGRHRIFDFLAPNRKSLLPELSSAKIGGPRRTLKLGKYRIPLSGPVIQSGRKSKPFWRVLGEHGVFSAIVRVPITFPPEKFHGVLLSAMCTPDLKGGQGTFFLFSNEPAPKGAADNGQLPGGIKLPLEVDGKTVRGRLPGPANTLLNDAPEMQLPFEIQLGDNGNEAQLVLGKEHHPLPLRALTPYIPVAFRAGLGIKVRGLIRLMLLETEPHFKLYVSPLLIDPGRPALPISHPFNYARYLAKSLGPFNTLGLAEETNALKAGVFTEEDFLQQAGDVHREREKMLFDALDKVRRGAVVCVFDITDRVQHMFFRHLDKDHPANRGRDFGQGDVAIKKVYGDMDELLGRVRARLGKNEVLMVMSDHGFKTFQRSVNLNSWLRENGYLALKGEAPTGADCFQDVDWSRTRAYALGFAGIYLNQAGREAKGIVKPGAEAEALKKEIAEKLAALQDDERGTNAVQQVYHASEVYHGPYAAEGPDLIVGFRVGYRAATAGVTGGIGNKIIEDNENDWSGDHNFNPPDVPGILFCNRKIATDQPRIIDLGPTALDLFGIPTPAWCDGHSLLPAEEEGRGEG